MLADLPESWPVTASADLHRGDWVVALRRDRVARPGAEEEFDRLVLEHPGAVIVLAVDDRERVLVLEQYRHPARTRFVELPAGLRDAGGETAEQTARRELREEARLEASTWQHLVTSYPSPGVSAERIEIFLATDLVGVDRGGFVPVHEEADMTVRWVPLDELVAAVLDGRVADGPTQLAVLVHAALSSTSPR